MTPLAWIPILIIAVFVGIHHHGLELGTRIQNVLTVLKIGYGEAIGDRPALLLGVLMIAVGFQLLALGLLGELIAFTNAGKSRPYKIREVVRREPEDEAAPTRPVNA